MTLLWSYVACCVPVCVLCCVCVCVCSVGVCSVWGSIWAAQRVCEVSMGAFAVWAVLHGACTGFFLVVWKLDRGV